MHNKKTRLTASTLKKSLWDTLENLKTHKIEVGEAVAVAGIAREIVRCTNSQLKLSAQTGRKMPKEVIDFSEK